MRRQTPLAALLLCSFLCLPTIQAQTTPDYKSNPKFQSAIAEAKQLKRERQINFAIDAYKKANKIADGKDFETLSELFALNSASAATRTPSPLRHALEAALPTPIVKSHAEANHGSPSSFKPAIRTSPIC